MRKLLLGLIGLLFAVPVFAACPSGQVEQTHTSATGTVTQNSTPTPTNPIEPTFYQQGNMVLRALKTNYGGIVYKDSYDATTGKITRRVGMRILDGTENWDVTTASVAENSYFYLSFDIPLPEGFSNGAISTHFPTVNVGTANNNQGIIVARRAATGYEGVYVRWNDLYMANSTTLNSFKQWLAEQYANGTPVTVYYPLATETTENWNETTYCATPIKIATTAYNTARFSPVVTELNDTIATIRSVVTNTINQTKAIADLQATKQTRPDETCPAGKKCLLVEDDAGMPHWYEIIESASRLPDGFTELQYIESTGTQYIDTGIKANSAYTYKFRLSRKSPYNSNIWGIKENSSYTAAPALILGWTVSDGIAAYSHAGTGTGNEASVVQWVDDQVFSIEFNPTGSILKIDGTNRWTEMKGSITTLTNAAFTSNLNPYIGGTNTVGSFVGGGTTRWYSYQVWNGNTLVQDLVPVQQGTSIGMYDAVSGRFFTNAGTGTFTAGPEI